MDERRRRGLAKMNEVYAWDMPDMPGDFFAVTVDHLFADIWSRPGLSMRDKRIMTLSVVTALGLPDLAEIQVNAALHNGEMTESDLREMAVFITHYVGFPLGSTFNGVVEKVIARRGASAGESPR
ncbi:MAG: carboxymuconolactone decarboxylase family protein [Mycobacterium sp.]